MCYKETRTVLWNPQDFLYTCDAHLSDPGFATLVDESSVPSTPGTSKVTLSEAELAKIKGEWEESQRKKKEKEQAAKDKDKEKEKEKESTSAVSTAASWIGWATGIGASSNANSGTAASPSTSSTEATPKKTPNSPNSLFASPNGTPTHQRFVLNRQIFQMRNSQFRKKRQIAQVNSVAPRLPIVPGHLS
ncbi:hypothetical protein CPB86DRAFT_779451 [Serendipita vermifera]|nr:hypothetical protein CPB86DRAFT_779451 [Serendipita vermifera]